MATKELEAKRIERLHSLAAELKSSASNISLDDLKGDAEKKGSGIIPLLVSATEEYEPSPYEKETGEVLTVGDGIATIAGLDNVNYGEVIQLADGVRGMVQDLQREYVGCILFGDDSHIASGSTAHRTGMTAGIPVGEDFLGRVVDSLGTPLDDKGRIQATDYYPVEAPAPGIIVRQPVNTPMETGILAIDSMFPIGRGQRELIIGDRQTGKTAIAIDTIINQKGKDVVCIYVAIGQKASSIARLVENLRKHDALSYSIVVASTASDPAPMQFIAPYAGCALGEYFMAQGKDVLIVYDDLSKHAVCYRSLSLLLDRSPGREAYPGDVFYLHSRLLERSARMNDANGGGSITALPIVETLGGDVSAYIPTNIISITDGQIFLESNLFFSGQRPAVNVGLSVSRVGGDAQTKAMKKAVGTLRLDLAQYREMEVFTQFSSDLDDATKNQLIYGKGLMELLKQPQYSPYSTVEQVVLLVAAMGHIMQKVDLKKINDFSAKLIKFVKAQETLLLDKIQKSGVMEPEDKDRILACAKKFLGIYGDN